MTTKAPTNPWLIAMIVSLATFMEVLDTTITNVSLRHIAGALGASQDESTWVLTSYLVSNGIILPLSGWMSDVIGRKKYFMGCILGFTLASFFCGAATSLTGLIISRIVQGAAGGGLQPTQQAIILDSFPPEKRGTVFAITGITMIVAPILGPTLGGLITDHVSWRWIFYINIPVGLFAAFMVWFKVEDPVHAKAQGFKHIDFVSLGLVSLGLAALQLVLDKGQQMDWFDNRFIFTWGVICFISLVTAIVWLWNKDEPIIDLSLLKDRTFASSCILIFVVGFVLYGSSALLPQLLQSHFGYTSTWAGFVLSPGGMAVLFLMPIAGKLVSKVQSKYLILCGLSLCAFGMYFSTQFTPQASIHNFILMRILQLLGLPFLFITVSTLAFTNIPAKRRNKASALFALSRNLGGSVGIAIMSTYVLRHQQLHQHRLAEHLIPGHGPYEELLTNIADHTGSLDIASGKIYSTLLEQSSICAYSDAFGLLCSIMIGTAIFTMLVVQRSEQASTKETANLH